MVCKAMDWEEVDHDFMEPKPEMAIFTAEELGISMKVLGTFKKPVPRTPFIVIRGNKKYIVNTEGYNYARYIQRIA